MAKFVTYSVKTPIVHKKKGKKCFKTEHIINKRLKNPDNEINLAVDLLFMGYGISLKELN